MAKTLFGDPNDRPIPLKHVLVKVPAGCTTLLVAKGQFSPNSKEKVRVGILEDAICLIDEWIAPEDFNLLVRALAKNRPVRSGQWDTMFATSWNYAWSTDRDDFIIYDRKGKLAWQVEGQLHLRSQEPIATSSMAAVQAYVSGNWVLRGVRVELKDGSAIKVAEERDVIALVDPTFDEINLLFEAAWAASLAQAIGQALAIPVQIDECLQ